VLQYVCDYTEKKATMTSRSVAPIDSWEFTEAEYCGFTSLSKITCNVTAWNSAGESDPVSKTGYTFAKGRLKFS
jgi:hypothetical protein